MVYGPMELCCDAEIEVKPDANANESGILMFGVALSVVIIIKLD